MEFDFGDDAMGEASRGNDITDAEATMMHITEVQTRAGDAFRSFVKTGHLYPDMSRLQEGGDSQEEWDVWGAVGCEDVDFLALEAYMAHVDRTSIDALSIATALGLIFEDGHIKLHETAGELYDNERALAKIREAATRLVKENTYRPDMQEQLTNALRFDSIVRVLTDRLGRLACYTDAEGWKDSRLLVGSLALDNTLPDAHTALLSRIRHLLKGARARILGVGAAQTARVMLPRTWDFSVPTSCESDEWKYGEVYGVPPKACMKCDGVHSASDCPLGHASCGARVARHAYAPHIAEENVGIYYSSDLIEASEVDRVDQERMWGFFSGSASAELKHVIRVAIEAISPEEIFKKGIDTLVAWVERQLKSDLGLQMERISFEYPYTFLYEDGIVQIHDPCVPETPQVDFFGFDRGPIPQHVRSARVRGSFKNKSDPIFADADFLLSLARGPVYKRGALGPDRCYTNMVASSTQGWPHLPPRAPRPGEPVNSDGQTFDVVPAFLRAMAFYSQDVLSRCICAQQWWSDDIALVYLGCKLGLFIDGKDMSPCFKAMVLLLGESRTGKSSIIKCLAAYVRDTITISVTKDIDIKSTFWAQPLLRDPDNPAIKGGAVFLEEIFSEEGKMTLSPQTQKSFSDRKSTMLIDVKHHAQQQVTLNHILFCMSNNQMIYEAGMGNRCCTFNHARLVPQEFMRKDIEDGGKHSCATILAGQAAAEVLHASVETFENGGSLKADMPYPEDEPYFQRSLIELQINFKRSHLLTPMARFVLAIFDNGYFRVPIDETGQQEGFGYGYYTFRPRPSWVPMEILHAHIQAESDEADIPKTVAFQKGMSIAMMASEVKHDLQTLLQLSGGRVYGLHYEEKPSPPISRHSLSRVVCEVRANAELVQGRASMLAVAVLEKVACVLRRGGVCDPPMRSSTACGYLKGLPCLVLGAMEDGDRTDYCDALGDASGVPSVAPPLPEMHRADTCLDEQCDTLHADEEEEKMWRDAYDMQESVQVQDALDLASACFGGAAGLYCVDHRPRSQELLCSILRVLEAAFYYRPQHMRIPCEPQTWRELLECAPFLAPSTAMDEN